MGSLLISCVFDRDMGMRPAALRLVTYERQERSHHVYEALTRLAQHTFIRLNIAWVTLNNDTMISYVNIV